MLRNIKVLAFIFLSLSFAHAQTIGPVPSSGGGGGAPTGAAGGDLSGTYPNPGVAKIVGVAPGTGVATALGVNVGTAGSVLLNGGSAGGDLTGTYPNPTVAKIGALAGSGTNCLNASNTGVISNASGPCQTALGVQKLGSVTGVSIGATGDTAMTLTLPPGATGFQVFRGMLQGKTGTFANGDTVGIYTGAGQTGTNLCAQGGLGGIVAVGDNVAGAIANLTCTTSIMVSDITTLFVNVGASTTSGTFDLHFYGVVK